MLGERFDRSAAAEFAVKATNRSGWSSLAHARRAPELQTLVSRPVETDWGFATEFVRRCVGPGYVEPNHGYVVHENGVLVEESMRPSRRSPKASVAQRHAIGAWLSASEAGRPACGSCTTTSVISLRHFCEWNYYHFFLDVLGKLSLIDRVGLDPATPLVLGHYATQVPFVRQVLARGELARRNWVLQDDAYVCASEISYCRSFESYRTKMDHLLDLMDVPAGSHDDSTDRVLPHATGGSTFRAQHGRDRAAAEGVRVRDRRHVEDDRRRADRHLCADAPSARRARRRDDEHHFSPRRADECSGDPSRGALLPRTS